MLALLVRTLILIVMGYVGILLFKSITEGSNSGGGSDIKLDLSGANLSNCTIGNVKIIGEYSGKLKVKVTFKNGNRITNINGKDYMFGGRFIIIKHGRLILDGEDMGFLE